MTWATFFKSRPVAYGSLAGILAFIAGGGASYTVAYHLAAFCAKAVDELTPIGENVTITELSTTVDRLNHSKAITWNDINIGLPEHSVSTINHLINCAYEIPDYCFYLSLTMGLCMVAAISLSLASTVAVAIYLGEEQEKKEALLRLPSFHKVPSFLSGHSFDYVRVPAGSP